MYFVYLNYDEAREYLSPLVRNCLIAFFDWPLVHVYMANCVTLHIYGRELLSPTIH